MKIENMEQYRGVYALLLTAFKEDKSVDYDGYAAYVEWQASNRPHYLFPVCGSSEMMDLTLSERLKIAETAAKHSGDVHGKLRLKKLKRWSRQAFTVLFL